MWAKHMAQHHCSVDACWCPTPCSTGWCYDLGGVQQRQDAAAAAQHTVRGVEGGWHECCVDVCMLGFSDCSCGCWRCWRCCTNTSLVSAVVGTTNRTCCAYGATALLLPTASPSQSCKTHTLCQHKHHCYLCCLHRREASGDARLMNPIAFAESHPQCERNAQVGHCCCCCCSWGLCALWVQLHCVLASSWS